MTKTHHSSDESMHDHKERARTLSTVRFLSYLLFHWPLQDSEAVSPWTRVSRFLPSTHTIMQFADGRPPLPNDVIVYVGGTFDLFHIGHLCFLEEAKKLGDYLVVGIYSDQVSQPFSPCLHAMRRLQTVNEYKGRNYPIMTLHERVLSVLAYKVRLRRHFDAYSKF